MSSIEDKCAEVFHPSEIIIDELEARGWSCADFASKMGIGKTDVFLLLSGHITVNDYVAGKLSRAFGTSKEFWLNIQKEYDGND